MKISQLRKILKEEIRETLREELQEMLTEAVKAASQVDLPTESVGALNKETVKERREPKNTNIFTGDPIKDILEETRNGLTNEDYNQVYSGGGSQVERPNLTTTNAHSMGMTGENAGVDLTKFDFAKKAGEIYQKSLAKDKERHGKI